MANLLYVTNDILHKVKQHKAYYFWLPIIQNFPIRNVSIEDRSFYARDVEVENGYIYLTIDMKFVYCRDNMLSFMYEDQDLSFRFTVTKGVLRTMDSKQFSAVIGRVAKVVASTEIELIDVHMVHHPLIDCDLLGPGKVPDITNAPLIAEVSLQQFEEKDLAPKRKRGRPRKSPAPTEKPEPSATKAKTKDTKSARQKAAAKTNGKSENLILDTYSKKICDKLYATRVDLKKSYAALSEEYEIPKDDVKKICKYYVELESSGGSSPASSSDSNKKSQQESIKKAVLAHPPELREKIFHMKNVSKKSYKYVAEKFDLPMNTIRMICSDNLKRPRLRNLE